MGRATAAMIPFRSLEIFRTWERTEQQPSEMWETITYAHQLVEVYVCVVPF